MHLLIIGIALGVIWERMTMLKEDVAATRAELALVKANVEEIGGDVDELAQKNEAHEVKIAELEAKIAELNDPELLADVLALKAEAAELTSLTRAIGDKVPEPVEDPIPTL